MTPRNEYRTNAPIRVNGETINPNEVYTSWHCGGALVLALIDPDSPEFDEVSHTRIVTGAAATRLAARLACR